MSPCRKLSLAFFLTSCLAYNSLLPMQGHAAPAEYGHALINNPAAVGPSRNLAVTSAIAVSYGAAGLVANYIAKDFGRYFVKTFFDPSGKSKAFPIVSVALKSFFNDGWKDYFANYEYQENDEKGQTKILKGIFKEITLKDDKATINSKFYSAGNKLMSFDEFMKYMLNAWHEWKKIYKVDEKSGQEEDVLIQLPAEWWLSSLISTIYNNDYSELTAASKSFAEHPASFINGAIWLSVAYRLNLFAQKFGQAAQRKFMAGVPGATPLARPMDIIFGFAFANLLEDYATDNLEKLFSYFNFYDEKAEPFLDRMYKAGNKLPFAVESAKALGLFFLYKSIINVGAAGLSKTAQLAKAVPGKTLEAAKAFATFAATRRLRGIVKPKAA